jgi:hypothetical protein
MHVIKPPFKLRGHNKACISFFLAGDNTDWRTKLISTLTSDTFYNAVIVDPYDSNFTPEVSIPWEFQAIHGADCVVVWFPAEKLSAVSMFELGALCRDHLKPIIVGVDSMYSKRDIVIEQLKLYRPDITVVSSLDELRDGMEHFVEVYSGVSYDTDYFLDSIKVGRTD